MRAFDVTKISLLCPVSMESVTKDHSGWYVHIKPYKNQWNPCTYNMGNLKDTCVTYKKNKCYKRISFIPFYVVYLWLSTGVRLCALEERVNIKINLIEWSTFHGGMQESQNVTFASFTTLTNAIQVKTSLERLLCYNTSLCEILWFSEHLIKS